MKQFIVTFANNKPVSVTLLAGAGHQGRNMEVELESGQKALKSITLYGDDEGDCMDMATDFAETIVGYL